MRKKEELSRMDTCMAHAHPEEMTFVLIGRDAAAPATIRRWVVERLRLGKNTEGDAQTEEALACAAMMEKEGRQWVGAATHYPPGMGETMRTIDMQDPKNRDTALDVARAASDTEGWGQMRAKECHALAEPDAMLWTAFRDKDHPEGVSVVAITGNGPTSEANARLFVDAKAMVLGLLNEIDRLKTIIRGERAR